MEGQTSFAEALKPSQAPVEAQVPEAAPELKTEEVVAAPVEAPKVEAQVPAAPVESEESKKSGLLGALMNERKKRQTLESQLQALQTANPTPQPDPYADTAGFVESKVGQLGKEFKTKINSMSETMARATHPDYQEKFDAFAEAALQNPDLFRMVDGSEHPGEAAYLTGKQILFEKKYGRDPEEIRKKLTDEIRPTIEAEVKAKYLGKLADRVNQPTNILNARAASGGTQEWAPTSWDRALSKRK